MLELVLNFFTFAQKKSEINFTNKVYHCLQVLEFYMQCQAMTTNANSLAILAGSLANGGVCPLTGVEVFTAETVKHCLSMMFSCGKTLAFCKKKLVEPSNFLRNHY